MRLTMRGSRVTKLESMHVSLACDLRWSARNEHHESLARVNHVRVQLCASREGMKDHMQATEKVTKGPVGVLMALRSLRTLRNQPMSGGESKGSDLKTPWMRLNTLGI